MGRPHALASAPRGRRSNAANQPLVALMACILVACAAIVMISRTGQQQQNGLSATGGAREDKAGAAAAAARPSSINGEVTSRIAGAIAARNRRREEERPQRLAEAAAAAAAAGEATGGVGGAVVGVGAEQEEEEEENEACAARPGPDGEPPQQLDLPDLGFDYPELRALKRRLRRALACSAGCPLSAVRRAYASALDEALSAPPPSGGQEGGGGGGYSAGPGGLLAAYRRKQKTAPTSSCADEEAAAGELRAFVRGALSALLLADGQGGSGGDQQQQRQQEQQATATKPTANGPLPPSALEQLAPCPSADLTLPRFPRGARLLLAANLRDAGRAAPSAAVQAVRLALALPPGGLAVGVHEGRSSDRTPFALAVLRLMLLPLRVPHNVTVGGAADPPPDRHPAGGGAGGGGGGAGGGGGTAMPRIERMAALRNAALAPWLGPWAVDESAAVDALALGVLPGLAEEEAEEEEQSGGGWGGRAAAKAPPHARLGPLARPDVVAFANDAFFCAEDVLRLAAHRAPIACGFDFYSAPWQVAAAAEAGERRARRGAQEPAAAAKEKQKDDDDDNASELEDPAVRRDYEEDYADEELREPKQKQDGEKGQEEEEATTTEAAAAAEGRRQKLQRGRGAARHYDKWVSRDRLGGRLSNRPPYVRDEASAKALSRGMPVAAYCCWNGLALLDAGPLGGTGAWAAAYEGKAAAGDGAAAATSSAPPVVVFRAGGHPHDCAASSECSLLCDDYRRHAAAMAAAAAAATATTSGGGAGARPISSSPPPPYRAVLDPAVRLAYDPAQSRALFFGGSDKRKGAPPPIPGFDVAPVDRALGPRRPWAEVSRAAARLANEGAVAPASVDCCGLRPGKNFVRFRSDCAPLEWRDDSE